MKFYWEVRWTTKSEFDGRDNLCSRSFRTEDKANKFIDWLASVKNITKTLTNKVDVQKLIAKAKESNA